mmetsp:Transcript_12477/g.26296  ORF Transcript_12477/g.26296 Transcript_12477/m.26296 type:complete len:200 (+) Transcript_12477:183-782(+)
MVPLGSPRPRCPRWQRPLRVVLPRYSHEAHRGRWHGPNVGHSHRNGAPAVRPGDERTPPEGQGRALGRTRPSLALHGREPRGRIPNPLQGHARLPQGTQGPQDLHHRLAGIPLHLWSGGPLHGAHQAAHRLPERRLGLQPQAHHAGNRTGGRTRCRQGLPHLRLDRERPDHVVVQGHRKEIQQVQDRGPTGTQLHPPGL